MSFDRVAGLFAPLEYLAFQGTMQRAREAHLAALDDARRVLVFGEGDGRFLAALARRRIAREETRPLVIRVAEPSAAMRRRLEARLESQLAPAHMQLEMVEDPEEMKARMPADFDAIVTCFFLDCFGPATLDELVPALAARLRPGGDLLLADFQIPPGGWPALHARIWSKILHLFFRATTGIESRRLAHFAARLGAAGLRLESHRAFRFEFVRSDCWRKPSPDLSPRSGSQSPRD